MTKLRRFIILTLVSAVLISCGGAPAAISTPEPAATSVATAPQAAATEAAAPAATATTEPTTEPTEEATAAVTAAAGATADIASQSDEEIIAGMQEAVDVWSEAFSTGNPELLKTIIDPKRPALRRTQEGLLKYYNESQTAGQMDWQGKVAEIKRRELGYVEASVDTSGGRRPFTFKQIKGTWMLSEPSRSELGKREKLETENFTIQYYPWDEDIVAEMGQLMEAAHEKNQEVLGRVPDEKPLVQLIPTIETMPGGGRAGVLAFYRRGSGARLGLKEMVVNSPQSFGFVAYDPAVGWQADLTETLAHEYVHLINDCCFTPIARMNDWMIEGIAEYVASGPRSRQAQVAYAVQNDSLIPIRDTTEGRVYKQDLENLSILEQDNSLAYGEASSLVDFIVRNYGGLDGFWKLVEEYDRTQNFDTALQNLHGISFDDFDKAWREDLQQIYGGG